MGAKRPDGNFAPLICARSINFFENLAIPKMLVNPNTLYNRCCILVWLWQSKCTDLRTGGDRLPVICGRVAPNLLFFTMAQAAQK